MAVCPPELEQDGSSVVAGGHPVDRYGTSGGIDQPDFRHAGPCVSAQFDGAVIVALPWYHSVGTADVSLLRKCIEVSMSRSFSAASSTDDATTVVALGVLAATVAAVCHETLGHGLGCLGSGGHVTLLTSIWFRCSKWSSFADAGGPAGNLVAGLLALALLRYCRRNATARLFLVLSAAINLFWFTAQLAFESLTDRHDDWYWILQMNPTAVWRLAGAAAGVGGYIMVARTVAGLVRDHDGPKADAIRLGYAAAAASAALAGLMWQPERLRSALEGLLTLGVTPVALLSIARRADRDRGNRAGDPSVPHSWIWISACAALFAAFLLIQARGWGPLAMSALSP